MTTAIICGAGIVSGKEIMALELGEGLREKGARIVYVTSHWGNGDFRRRLEALAFPFYQMRIGFVSATLRLDTLLMTADQLLHWPKLLFDYVSFLRREQPRHVVHTNWHHVVVLWPFLRPSRDIFWLHELLPDKPQYARLFTRLAKRVRCIVAVSHAVALSLRRNGVPDDKIRVIHNGIADPSTFAVTRSEGGEAGRIGIVGQVGAWKGHEDLCAAFEAVAGRYPYATLHVFGGGRPEFALLLKQRVLAMGLAERVVWHGSRERSEIYTAIDLCVVPSRIEEAFGLVAIEAGFFALPVIATRRGGLPEIVVDGVTGYLVDAEQPEQLASRICEYLGNPELARQMGAAARERAVRCFGREKFSSDMCDLLEIKR